MIGEVPSRFGQNLLRRLGRSALCHGTRLIRLIELFRKAKKCWSWPKKSDVLIFDAAGEVLLREYLDKWSSEVLSVRGESVNLRVFLASLFISGKRSDAYFDAYIRRVTPRVLVTFVDNSPTFYRVASRYARGKTVFIQNGWRGYRGDVFEWLATEKQGEGADKFNVDYMLCFGTAIGRHYQRFINGQVVAIGSLRSNHQARSSVIVPGAIAFISQWRNRGMEVVGKSYSQEEIAGTSDRRIIGFLVEYARKNGKSVYIIPRMPAGSVEREQEAQYFSVLLGEPCRFLEYDSRGSAYQAVDAAEVVVGIDSTLVYESIARGNKTAVFSIRGAMTGLEGYEFGWPMQLPSEGPFWTNTPSHDKFDAVLNFLFSINDDEWREELTRHRFEELMVFNPGNTVLGETLSRALVA